MTEEEQLVQLGEDAEAVLNSPAFERTVNKLVESTFQAFVNSKADEEDLRKQTYSHYRALVDVVNTLKQLFCSTNSKPKFGE